MIDYCLSPACSCRAAGGLKPDCYSGDGGGIVIALARLFGSRNVRIVPGPRLLVHVSLDREAGGQDAGTVEFFGHRLMRDCIDLPSNTDRTATVETMARRFEGQWQ